MSIIVESSYSERPDYTKSVCDGSPESLKNEQELSIFNSKITEIDKKIDNDRDCASSIDKVPQGVSDIDIESIVNAVKCKHNIEFLEQYKEHLREYLNGKY